MLPKIWENDFEKKDLNRPCLMTICKLKYIYTQIECLSSVSVEVYCLARNKKI